MGRDLILKIFEISSQSRRKKAWNLLAEVGNFAQEGNKMSRKTIGIILVIAFGVVQLSLLPGCNVKRGGVEIGAPPPEPSSPPKGGPPPWAPAHGYRAKHRYRYYPSFYVYFDLGRRVYFYLEGNTWRVSARLPSTIRIESANYVTIELETDKPYKYFTEHKKKYPPGQAKKNKQHKWK